MKKMNGSVQNERNCMLLGALGLFVILSVVPFGTMRAMDQSAEEEASSIESDRSFTDEEDFESGDDRKSSPRDQYEVEWVEDPVRLAIESGNNQYLRELLSEPGIDCDMPDRWGVTPLLAAIDRQDIGAVRLLLGDDAAIQRFRYTAASNKGDHDCRTPLMWAAHTGNKEMVKLLIKAGAHLNAQDVHRHTALWYALHNQHYAIAHFLLLCGAGASPAQYRDMENTTDDMAYDMTYTDRVWGIVCTGSGNNLEMALAVSLYYVPDLLILAVEQVRFRAFEILIKRIAGHQELLESIKMRLTRKLMTTYLSPEERSLLQQMYQMIFPHRSVDYSVDYREWMNELGYRGSARRRLEFDDMSS